MAYGVEMLGLEVACLCIWFKTYLMSFEKSRKSIEVSPGKHESGNILSRLLDAEQSTTSRDNHFWRIDIVCVLEKAISSRVLQRILKQ